MGRAFKINGLCRWVGTVLIAGTAVIVTSAQAAVFPGLTPAAKKQLTAAKRWAPVALPTWLPDGFAVEEVRMKLGPRVKLEDKLLAIIYAKKMPDGKTQRFAIEAGFDGLGDLMYDGGKRIRSRVGDIYLYYQPLGEDDKKIMDFAMTEWFGVGGTAFHYQGMFTDNDEDIGSLAMVSRVETERILASIRRY